MRRQSQDEAATAARARLELLGRELAQAGLDPPMRAERAPLRPWEANPDAPVPETPDPALADTVVRAPTVVPDPGRHARRRVSSLIARAGGWLDDRLPATLRGRVSLRPAHLAVVACLVALGLAMAAVTVLRSGSGGDAVPLAGPATPLIPTANGRAAVAPLEQPGPAPGVPSGDAATTPGAASGSVVVDVAGRVRRPGIATLPAGSRVADALRRAGGARRGVDLTSLNLARVLVDGEQILVGVRSAPGLAASAAAAPGASSPPGQLVNLNTATLADLDTLPGVGPVTAQKIVDWRTQHHAFSSVDELLEVDGIGAKTLADIAPFVTL